MDAFQETWTQIRENPDLQARTRDMQEKTKLYPEGFAAAASRIKNKTPDILVRADTTFHCAQTLAVPGKRTAVLNFANPHNPGGGVLWGAMAQEECLCRSSNLYAALRMPWLREQYYQWNRDHTDDMGTDKLIYSPDVTVFRSDHGCPENLETWFCVDVITSAAPYYNKYAVKPVTKERLAAVFSGRIRNVLEAAIDQNVDYLVLGAFGCGAFNNPPELVARVFHQLLVEEGYGMYFEKIVFAIKTTGANRSNLNAFRECFQR